MNDVVLVRVQKEQLEKIRKLFPELASEDNTTLIRVALNRFLAPQVLRHFTDTEVEK